MNKNKNSINGVAMGLVLMQSAGAAVIYPESAAFAQSVSAICMAPPNVDGAANFIVGVMPEFQSVMESRGFVVVPCPDGADSQTEYRQKICAQAATAPPATKSGFQAEYNVSFDELCSMAGGPPSN